MKIEILLQVLTRCLVLYINKKARLKSTGEVVAVKIVKHNPEDPEELEDFQVEIGKEVLSVDPTYFRPSEVDLLIGDPSKAKNKLGWIPEYDLFSLVKDMMQGDIALMKKDIDLLKAGHDILK